MIFRGVEYMEGYGFLIVLAHGPFTTLYGHLSAINVEYGQSVSAGQGVGAVGNSSNSSGSHLAAEISHNAISRSTRTSTMPF